ncbi:MAG: YmdB family metallophosphoesterase, partial [Thermus sp.]|nr:YmdB family metallophosphoesterase [Thermus sp.]
GLRAVSLHLPDIRDRYDLVIANGENAAKGKGLDKRSYRILRDAGVDLVSLGNHAWDHKEVYELLEKEPVVRAFNYPPGTPGKGFHRLVTGEGSLLFVQVMGRIFMDPLDDPFRALDALLAQEKADYILVEVHAEATSEKMALAHYLDGRVSAVLGTHTHVPTLDAMRLPKGTLYQTDVGMTGTYESIIGGEVETFLNRFLTGRPQPFRAAQGRARLHATELFWEGGEAVSISPYVWEEP